MHINDNVLHASYEFKVSVERRSHVVHIADILIG